MELYLSACSKTANVAAKKAASSSVAEDSQQCGDGAHKAPIPGVGAAQLLDLPLGVKLPMIPGTDTVYFTTNISEKLFRPSYGFNLSDPYCRLLETQYKSLHDPHLRTYYKRKDILRRLKKGGYITSNNKIVCSLRELNKYRQYLTSLKLDFERNYLREQQLITKQLHKLQETSQLPHCSDVTRFQNWLLQDNTQSIKDQERLLRHRYLDMISRELEQLERTAEEQRLLRMDREERRQREYTRKKLSLRRKIEEEWKTKEMMLLTKIGEDVKREQRVEEQRRRSREESDRKKQAMLERKMAYHLQKMQDTGIKDDTGRNGFEYKGQNGAPYESSIKKKMKQFDDIKIVYPDGEEKTCKGTSGQVSSVVNQSQSSSKNVTKISGSSVAYQPDIQNSSSEQKRNGVTKKLSDERVPVNTSARNSIISAQISPTKNTRLSHASLAPQKDEKDMQGDWNGRPSKKSSYVGEPGSQGGAPPPGIFSSPVYSNMQQNLQNCLQDKITSEELNSIIQNIMTWVVATVTSILYPAITKYEERVQSNTYPVSDSDLSSDSSSFCSTCSEGFTYRSYTAKTFQPDPCVFASDIPVKKPPTPLKPPSAHVERTVIGKEYHMRGQSVSSQVNYNKTSLEYPFPKIGSSKSDSHLVTSLETNTKKSKDATTETDSLEIPLLYDQKAKAMDQMKNLKNVFVNFKCHLKGETQLILESIFQEIMSDLSQAIPSLSSVTAEVFVDQCDAEREDLLSNVDICSVASEIVENMLEKLESAVEKKCVQLFSQEDLTIDIKPSLSTSGEYFSSLDTKPSEDTLTCSLEPMCDIADDMVHAILEKLMTLASYKKSEVPPEDTTKHFHQQIKTEPTHKFHKKTDQKKSSPESDAANLIVKEEIQNLISNIFTQSSLVGYVEEAISTILGYVQTELNNERLIASEETVVLLQLLDDVLTQLHQGPAKKSIKKHRQPRVRNLPDVEEKYRLTGTKSFNGLRNKRPFPPVNVPGMVLYSEDDDEEIDNLVKSVLDSSFCDEKAKSQEHITNHWPTKRDTCFEYKRSNKVPTKTSQNKPGSHDWGLKLALSLSSEDIVKAKNCLINDASIFSQDQKYQIQKASEKIVKHILTDMFKDMFSISSHYPGSKIGEETSDCISEKSQGLPNQDWMEQLFSGSEICALAHEITDSVINILHKASKYIPNTIKNAISSVHQTCLDHSDTPQTAKEISSKTPFKVWFDSEKKMKYLSSLNVELEKTSQLRSGECEPKRVNDITDKIINTIFKSLKLFVCPKLKRHNKSSLVETSLHSQLSTYTMKIVKIVLHAIQNELGRNKTNPNTRETDHIKCHANKGLFADPNEAVDSHMSNVNDIMESPLLTCICEMISSTNEDQTNTSTFADKAVSTTLCGSDNVNKQNILSSKQDRNSFKQYMATPCTHHSIINGKDLKDSPKLKVLDQIGETLHEMLSKLTGVHHDSQPSCSQQDTEKSHKDPPTLSNVQLISKAILEYVLAKLCDIDIDTSIVNSGLKTVSETIDIDNLSFASIMEEMAKCTIIISNIISKMMMGNKEITKNKAKNDLPGSSKTENSKGICPNKLKTVASDILNMVFAKLEGFASGSVENVSVLNDENKKENNMDLECESKNSPTDSHDKSLQSTLYNHAKKVSNAILKAIQTELNINPSDCKENRKSSPQETQMFTNIVDLILDVVSSDVFIEPESENRGIENYGYRPIYGNFLPGGAESESLLDGDDTQNKELFRDRTSPRKETSTFSTDQWILERILNKIEVKLKEPHKSPIIPIIRNILNEIFQSALISQLNIISLSHSHFTGMPHNVPVSTIQTSQFLNPLMDPLVSDTDVTVVVNDVVRTVFHKLFSAAMTEKPVSENRCETIIFSTNVSFHEHTYAGNRPVSVLNRNPCDIQSSWNVDKQTKINVVEDIVQAILENLENFAASKVESLFHPQVDFRVPVTLPVQREGGSLSKALSDKDSYSDNQFPCSLVDHGAPEKMDTWCQLSLSKLNIYAKEVARKILQGIKYELDKEQESPLLTNNIVFSENIASQIVNTVLDIVSCKTKYDKNSSDKDNNSDQQDGIIERLVNKTEYRKILEFQIQDTIEGILCDIYENIIYQNNLSFATPTLKYSIPTKHLEANLQPVVGGTNIIPKVSVPKTDVILVSKDIVDIVLHSLTSLVMLAINAKDPASARLAFYDMFPKSQCQQHLFITHRTEEQPGHFLHSEDKNLAYADADQMPMKRNEDTREPALDPCEENANFITETIYNRLQSFATERINSLITPAFQSNKENVFISQEFENGKNNDSIFHEPSQVESGVNVLKLSTIETDANQELSEPVFASCGESLGTTIHLSQTTLKDYADFIASTILKLIKNDLDLEIQNMHMYSNNILFQKNIIVSEIVNSILRILHNKGSVKEFFLPSSENPRFPQLTIPNEVLLGYKEKGNTDTLSQFTNHPLEESQIILEKESQRVILEEIFMRKGDSKPREKTKIFSAVEEVLKKLSQNIMEIIGHLPPFNEIPYIVSKSKSKTSGITQKKFFQSHINNVSNDILENILGEMHSVVVTSLYKKTKSRKEVEMLDNNVTSVKASCFKETKPARKRSNPPRFGAPEMHPYTDNLNALVLENTFLPYSPLQIGRYLIQIVLDKLSNFVSLHLEERFLFEGSYDDMYLLRLHNSKLSPKNSPRPGCKTSLKGRSKITSLYKFKTKPHLGISGTKSKSKTKLGAGEKTPRENRSKTALGLPQTSPTEDAKVILKTKLPASELRIYAKNIITDILEIIMKELEIVVQNRAVLNTKVLVSGQILEASKIVNAVLQELYATNNHILASPINVSNLGDFRLSKQNLGAGSPTEQQACFYLENVSSQLEQIFPKEGIFKKMFDKWQTETSDTENEKSKLLTIAENILTEISIKAKDLEYSLSLLNLPPLEDPESRFYDRFKCGSTRAEDTKAQINMFGREIVEMLFEKLQLCFLSQMPTQDSKGILTSRKEHVTPKSKHGVPNKHNLCGVQTCNTKMKDQMSTSPSNQIVQEIVERVLNMLESFVDLKFKHISKYEFSEIVKMPIDNLFQVQQRQLSKKTLPKLQPLSKFGDEPKSSTIISKENIQNTLLQVHSFHSELLTYSITTVSDMLSIVKNKLDKEISQMEPFPVSILKENIAASEIIGTLIDHCTHFDDSLITKLPNKNWFKATENVYIVNQVEFASPIRMPTSKMRNTSMRSNTPQRSVSSGLGFNSEDDTKQKYEVTSNSPSHISSCVENKIKSSEPMGRPTSKAVPPCSRNKAQDQSQKKQNFGLVDGTTKGNNSLPEGSVLQKLFKKANDSTEESLKQVMSFIEMGKGENPRVFHYETTKPIEPNEIKTNASPLKICLAADNIVNTVLSSYGFPHQSHSDESLETMKPFFMSRQNPLSTVCEGEKDEKNLLKMWYKRMACINEEESEGPEACQGDFSLLHKWKNKNSKMTMETLEETDTITFDDHELGPNEMHLVARHVTTSVITHLKNFKAAVSTDEKLSHVSSPPKKNYDSKQPLKSIYTNSSMYQFCEYLSESVICYLISNISDDTKEGNKDKPWEIQDILANKNISINSQVYKSRTISIGELALSIFEVIIEILSNGNIVSADKAHQAAIKTKYRFCPSVTSSNIDDIFQDLLKGVICVLSKVLGIEHHFENNIRNKTVTNSMPIFNKINTVESQIGPKGLESSPHLIDHLAQRNKLNYLACRLNSLVGNLKSHESKEVVNEVFNIVLDLFLPDEIPDGDMSSGKLSRTFFTSDNQQSNRILTNNLGLSPKSVFLLNIVCEKLIRTLLEKCTGSAFLEDSSLFREVAEECHHRKLLRSVQGGDFDYCKAPMDSEQFQDYMPDILENLADMDQDLLSSDCVLNVISHSMVKSLMDKLSHGFQQAPFENKCMNYRAREIQPFFPKAKRRELTELGQNNAHVGFMSNDNSFLNRSLNNANAASFKTQTTFGKQRAIKPFSLSLPDKQQTRGMNTVAFSKLCQRGANSVYSATFLEDIISELFFKLTTSLWRKNINISETWLNDINTSLINYVVNELNNAQITVLRYPEERLYFPSAHKECVTKIVDSIYYDVVQQYEFKITCGNNLSYDNTSVAERMYNSILLEIVDYQLPSCFKGKLRSNSYHTLNAEIILYKLQNNLRKYISEPISSKDYSTMLPHSFLEYVIRRLLAQLIPLPIKPSPPEKQCLMSSNFNEMSNCITNKVMSAISKHKIWFTIYDNQCLHTDKNLQKMVDSVYSNILQMSDSLDLIQKNIISRSPIMIDQIASFIIQEIIENHLQPFLCGEILPRPKTPLDEVSYMVKQVLSEVVESHKLQKPSPFGIYPDKFVGEIVTRVLSKIFSPNPNTNTEMENMTQKIVNSVNNHLDKSKIPILCDKQSSFPFSDTDIVDELVTSVYRNVLKQHGLDADIDESENSDAFVENIAKLIMAAISDYLLHPLFSGDLSAASCSNSMADNIIYDVLGNINKSGKPNQCLPPYNTLLPYTFLENMIRVLLSKIFPFPKMVSNTAAPKDKGVNFNEIASNLISDIRRKISQHEIRFSKDEDKAKSFYSEDDVRHLVDSVFTNILEDSESQESVEENITKSNEVFIDKIAGLIIKYVCEQHLQPFVEKRQLSTAPCKCFDDRPQFLYASAYSSTFLEDVVSGVVSKIFHRVVGIVQVESTRNSEDALFDKAESLIYWITEEFSKAQVTTIENAEERLCFPPVEKDALKNIIDTVYRKVLEEYEMEMMPDNDFLDDTKALAGKITKIILTEILDFQIPPDLIANLPVSLHSKLSQNTLVNRVHYDISKSRFRRQASTIYTTMLSHIHLEKIVTQLMSQISPSHSSVEHSGTSQSDLSNTVMKLINEIMSIISKHAICIVKHGNEKQSMISEKDIQSMVDSIYADLSHSNLYQSLTKDKKGVSSIPVSKIASFIIKEIFNHHLESFLSGNKSFLSASVVQPCKQKATNPKQRELSFIMNSAVFLEEVISELLCKILQTFVQNSLADETPEKAIAKIMDIVTTLVKSIVLEFTASEILLAENLDESLWFSETYKEMVQNTVNSVYENIIDKYKSLTQLHRALQNDTSCIGGKIYHFLLEEIYDYQVQSLVSGELMPSSYSFPRAENIIKNVLNVILKDTNALPSCITVLPCSLIENMVYKLLVNIFPTDDTTSKLKEKEVGSDDGDEFLAAASKLTDEIIKEISEHEIRFATEEENAECAQLGTTENFVDSVCNNILKNSDFQAEVQKDAHKKGGSFLSKMAGFIMKEVMDHHLRPFLYGEDSSSANLPEYGHASVVTTSGKEKAQPSLFSAAFLEDVIVDLAHKFCSFATVTEDSRKNDKPEPEIVSLAINFANSLIREFRKSEIKVLPHAEEIFSFPPIGKETVDEISNFVYDQFIGKFGSDSIQKDDSGNIVIEMVSSLAQKAISAFKIQPLFSGDWCSTFFSFLDPENITQRVQLIPQKTSMQISQCLKQSQLALSKDLSMKKDDAQSPILNSIATMMKSNIINLMSGSTTGGTDTKKEDENKLKSTTQKYENVSEVMSPTTSMKSKGTQVQHVSDKCKTNETEKENLVLINEQGQMIEIYTHFSVATVENSSEKEVPVSDFVTDNEGKMDNASKSLVKTDDKPKSKSKESIRDKTVKIAQQPVMEERTQSVAETDIDEELYSETERVENVIENIYDNVLISSQEPLDFSKPIYSKGLLSDKALVILQDSAQNVKTKELSPPVNRDITANKKASEETETKKEDKTEIRKEKDIKIQPSKPDHPQSPSESKPTIIPAKFLEDVITELVNKLIFTSSPEKKPCDRTPKATEDQHQDELYDTAMKLIDSMVKQFSDAEVKVFRPEKGNEIQTTKESEAHMGPPEVKEATTDKPASSMNTKNVDKLPHTHKTNEQSSSDKIPSIDRTPSAEKSIVNKIVHSCVCNVLKECTSQESVCKNINNNGEKLAKRLTSTVISEIFQHQLNMIFSDEIPTSACVPLESKDVEKKVQKAVETASKECQTSSPYTIKLPFKFLDDVISALLAKVFSKLYNVKTKISQQNVLTQLDFLQMKLVSTVAAEIAKNEDMIIQYVESLHPNDDEIIQLVVQTIYNNLLPQFGSQETIQNCISSGCRLLSKTIVDLVLREVAGNQLQNYFGGELTPYQCAEVDNVVENILTNVALTTPSQPPHPRKLSYNVIEAISVKFLSKLLSLFPKVHMERNKSQETEMQKISSKILKSIQECISKSKIKVVKPDKESEPVPLADDETIEKVANSVYTNLLKHSGSATSVFEDLMGKSNVLPDIIGSLMVKEISNSEFQHQAEEELSSSELVLEAVKIMDKVVKIIDELKSQDKPSSINDLMLDSRVLEEALALFLAKLVKKPGAVSKNTDNLTTPELNKIASQLTKSVTAEISRSNISLVDSDPEEQSLDPENIEMISQVIESVYNNLVNQSIAHDELYDIKGTKKSFPKKVASLIVHGVSNVPSCRVSTKSSSAGAFGDIDTNRIVEKAQKHAARMNSDSDTESDDVLEEELPVRIIPHVGNKPLKIDPNIIAEHLAVISMKTLPLETLKMDCIKRTGYSIAELRRASISGKGYSSTDVSELGRRQKERRISLDRSGRLDVKPLEAVGRNSFQNVRKPDITRVELLKDIHNKKDLIVRLVAHDISQKDLEGSFREDMVSDEEEIVLGEVVGHQCLGEISEDHVQEVVKPLETQVVSPKTTTSTSSLRKFLALSKCCHPTSGENIESIEATGNQTMEPIKTHVKRTVAELDMPSSKSLAEGPSSREKLQYKKEESLAMEPTHYFIHRIMSTSSYNQEDLISGEAEEFKPDLKARALEECSQEPQAGNSSSFVTIFEGSKNMANSACPSKEHISETSKNIISKQGSKVLAKVSSTLSKVFSRSSGNIPKSSSPPHQDKC
ncbi:fibrous sheath-interacting protein 2 [Phodopus roborovskii]|uniref:fibrous sheath-interacting protein 2 n=1 Tax=Phodopus roborovskii TaxID=109678 RepID=UPI0021E4402D|nr:fibrous sheath-interacting protein 2 [Phodopus roborovskii]